jgi:hypothetical protein
VANCEARVRCSDVTGPTPGATIPGVKALARFTLAFCSSVSFATGWPLAAEPDTAQPYRFTVTAWKGSGEVELRGVLSVDGKVRAVAPQRTPFEFGCEAGSVITGYFESLTPDRKLRLSVFDPSYSKRKVAVKLYGWKHARFAWAKPGVGPRCIDGGSGGCPDSVPSFEQMVKLLE